MKSGRNTDGEGPLPGSTGVAGGLARSVVGGRQGRSVFRGLWLFALALGFWLSPSTVLAVRPGHFGMATASSCAPESPAAGAVDGERFGTGPGALWRGGAGDSNWWWELRFPAPRRIGAVLQIWGDHDFVFRHGPTAYRWEANVDGRAWKAWPEARQERETRTFRLTRLKRAWEVQAVRLIVDRADGPAPVVREIEFFEKPEAAIDFPEWCVVVNVTHDPVVPGHGQEFIPLARSTGAGRDLQAQQIWLPTFDPGFVNVEPRPLCAFLSGSFKDWCAVDRRHWRGTASILRQARMPIWASCGGAQGLAILAEAGAARPWDCPHCRDPRRPRIPIYTHIGHTTARPCGDYSGCVFERGLHEVRTVGADPVFAGLPPAFRVMESHCGQIEWAPRGWELIATAGEGTLTKTQCLRRKGYPIYAAQFHIEMAGSPDVSRRIMENFIGMARAARR